MVGGVLGRSERVTAVILHPRNELALAKSKEATTNAYLRPPAYLDGIPRLQTATLPTNETQGTSSLCNSMVAGDFSQLGLGVRTEFGINVFEQPASTTGQLLVMAWFRGDVQVLRGTAFAVRTGLLP
jgi:HK97 family phage major capsid protein